jgi:acyl dehydratase
MGTAFEPQGRYFEEFAIGDTFVSAGRTITEADIVNFAGLSGDFTQFHTNAESARQSVFGQRVAHGLLVLSVASGLVAQMGIVNGDVLSFLLQKNYWQLLAWMKTLPARSKNL